MWNLLSNPINFKARVLCIGLCILFICLPGNRLYAEGSNKINVNTSSYEDIKINLTHTLSGVVPAAQDSDISAQISAIISVFHVDTGHEVKKNDLLVSLGCRKNTLKLKQADAILKAENVQLNHAITQFNQAKKLNKQGNISKQLYNQREAEEHRLIATHENKKAARELAQINVDHCQVKAPYDGYITQRHASIGELTQSGTVLLHLVSKTNDTVEVKINHGLFDSFTQGENHQFIYDSKSYALEIKYIVPILDKKTRTHIARLNFINEHAVTGSIGKVKWQEALTSIPSRFIVLRDKKLGIMIADNGIAKFIKIENADEGQPAQITLDDATQIITKGRFNVRDGDAIIVKP
ncbi:MAG: efflux RND transporter periplasmic adaptor subunit [Gammaproteobacteria bacterium]|nr:efflux RND transporter periplasmic adaptor subunit [Gammaproteobacteria bacterium]